MHLARADQKLVNRETWRPAALVTPAGSVAAAGAVVPATAVTVSSSLPAMVNPRRARFPGFTPSDTGVLI